MTTSPMQEWFSVTKSDVALAFSALALIFTGLTYRRSDANVRLHLHTTFNPEEPHRPMLTVKAMNRGMASVQLVNLYLRLKDMKGVQVNPYVDSGSYLLQRRKWISPGRYLTGKVPKVLKGYSQNLWSVPRVGLLESPVEGRRVKMRAVAQLAGSKKRVRSKWVSVRVRPLVPLPKKGPSGETIYAELVESDDKGGAQSVEPDPFAKPGPPPIPDEVKERVKNGESVGTFEFVNEQGEVTEAKFIAAPDGWRPGDPVPFETIEQFKFDSDSESNEQSTDDAAEGEAN